MTEEIERLKNLNLFAQKGYLYGKLNETLDDVDLNSLISTVGKITGEYSQEVLNPVPLNSLIEFRPIIQLGTEIFRNYFNNPNLEAYISSAALLTSPQETYTGRVQRPQVFHADNIGFVSITAIVMLSDIGYSTHIIPQQYYGPDFPEYCGQNRQELLTFDMDHISKEIREAVKERYHDLMTYNPDRLFRMAENKSMSKKEFVMLRSDLLHAGPRGNRKVLFLELRVIGEMVPIDKGYQYRVTNLMEITGKYTGQEIQNFRNMWERQGYFFPQEPEAHEPEEETPGAITATNKKRNTRSSGKKK